MRINLISNATFNYRKSNVQNQAQAANPIKASQSFYGMSEIASRRANILDMHKDGAFVREGRIGINRSDLKAMLDILLPEKESDVSKELQLVDITGLVDAIRTSQHLKLATALAKSAVQEGNSALARFMSTIVFNAKTPQSAEAKLKAFEALSQMRNEKPALTAEDIGVTLMRAPDTITARALAEDILKRK